MEFPQTGLLFTLGSGWQAPHNLQSSDQQILHGPLSWSFAEDFKGP